MRPMQAGFGKADQDVAMKRLQPLHLLHEAQGGRYRILQGLDGPYEVLVDLCPQPVAR